MPEAAYSRPRAQCFPIRTSQPVNNIYQLNNNSTDELFVDIPENKDLGKVLRHVLVNFYCVLMESPFRSNILLKSGQDFTFSLTAKIQNSQMIMASTILHRICSFLFRSPSSFGFLLRCSLYQIIMFYTIFLFIIHILCCERTSASITVLKSQAFAIAA